MQEETTKDTEVKDQNQSQTAAEQTQPEQKVEEATQPEAQAQQTEPVQEQQTAEEPSVEELLTAAKEENAKLQDLYLRALAEAENARRRAEDAVEKAHKFGVEKFAKNLLPVLDSLEKALELSKDPEDPVMQGVQATYRQFVQAMEKAA